MQTTKTDRNQSLELLNAVQAKLIEFANENGICLADEFETVDKFKAFVIAFTFRQLVEIGIETKIAYNMVLGEGAYENLAEKVWQSFQ